MDARKPQRLLHRQSDARIRRVCEIEGQFLSQLFVRPGAVVEVGANVGTHTVALARQAAQQRREMFAFEPQPFIFQNLCANLALNGITNVRAWPWACGAKAETVYFSSPDYNAPGNFGGVSMHASPANQDIAIPCVRLDDVLADHPVGLIKIDVEALNYIRCKGPLIFWPHRALYCIWRTTGMISRRR